MLKIEDRDRVRSLLLDRAPVNAIEGELVGALENALFEAVADPEVTAVVLGSTSPRIFSAGLDLATLSRLDRPEFNLFFSGFERLAR